jgi:hypothetical protein
MTNKLSHSSVSTYTTCAYKYKLRYIEKLYPKNPSAALLFGTAIDKALTDMLNDHAANNIDWLGQTYKTTFINNWRRGEVNKKIVDLYDNPDVVYAASDMDWKLMSNKDFDALLTAATSLYPGVGPLPKGDHADLVDLFKAIGKQKEADGWNNLNDDQRKYYNYANWLCLSIKGELMIKAYLEKIIPRIKRVISAQRAIDIQSDSGDSITGFIDLIAIWEDGRTIVFDNKTSAREYEADAVLKSPQLAIYSHALENELKSRTAGFIVLRKLINKNASKKCSVCNMDGEGNRARTCNNEIGGKRCSGEWEEVLRPAADIQVLISDIPEQTEAITIQNFEEVNHAIKAQVFPRNMSACKNGSLICPYYSVCWHNNNKDVVKIEK